MLDYERVLRACFGSILAAAGPAVAVASCGTTPTACGGCGCGGSDAQSQSYNVTYTVCAAADAGAEASTDGGAVVDAGACFYTCAEACLNLKPSSLAGTGVCVGEPDAGAGETATAGCQTSVVCLGRNLEGAQAPEGEWLAQAAWLEGASVYAFVRLARELEAHGAPKDLVARARRSARDEARHARMMRALAKKRGIDAPRARAPRAPVRDLESVARENAIEGCVGETYGALLAAHRAEHDADPEMREVMAEIAPDELRHAALGWSVAEWAEGKLTPEARARVRGARDSAAWAMVASAASTREASLARALMTSVWQPMS